MSLVRRYWRRLMCRVRGHRCDEYYGGSLICSRCLRYAHHLVLVVAVLGFPGLAWAQVGCVPNPNLPGPPFVDGCGIPAAGLNKLWPTTISGGFGVVGVDFTGGQFGAPVALFASQGGLQNTLIGAVDQNNPAAFVSFPTGTTGYGLNSSNAGNGVFGMFGLATITGAPGWGVAAEFTARNLSGSSPDTNLPPNVAIPTTTVVPISLNVTCSTVTNAKDCSLGINIANESGIASQPNFNTAIFISLFRQYGLFIAAQPTGTQTSAVFQNNGSGASLQLQTTGSVQPNNAVLSVFNSASSSVAVAGIFQSGALFSRSIATASLPTCTAEGLLQPVNDASTNTHGSTFTGLGSNHIVAYCTNVGSWVVLYP